MLEGNQADKYITDTLAPLDTVVSIDSRSVFDIICLQKNNGNM